MKKLLIICALLALANQISRAQIPVPLEVTTNILPPYPMKFQSWLSDTANYMVTVQNHSDVSLDYYLIFSLESTNTAEETYIRLVDGFFPQAPFSIDAFGVDVITSSDIQAAYENLLTADVETSGNINLISGGELPEGEYVLCFEVLFYNADNEILLGPTACSEPFDVSHGDIYLNYPVNDMVIDEGGIIPFQWIANTSSPVDFDYALRIMEVDPAVIEEESIEEIFYDLSLAPFYYEDGIMINNLDYDPAQGDIEMTPGRMYVAQVTAVDALNSIYLENSGRSNIVSFWYGSNPNDDGFLSTDPNAEDDDGSSQLTCATRCEPPSPDNTNQMGSVDGVQSFTIGHFTVDNVESSSSGGTLNGTGEVTLDFLGNIKVAVSISGVQLNTNGEALAGTITAQIGGHGIGIVENASSMLETSGALDTSTLRSLNEAVENFSDIYNYASGQAVELPFGISQSLAGQYFSMAIIGFELGVNSSAMDVVNIIDIPALGEHVSLGLGAAGICVAPDGFGGEYIIHLAQDLNLPLDGDLTLTFRGGTHDDSQGFSSGDQAAPTGIEMDCNGLKAINLSGSVDFPQSLLLKEDDAGEIVEGELVKAYFSTYFERAVDQEENVYEIQETSGSSQFMVGLTMDPFQIKGLDGWGFRVSEATLDLSDADNPANLSFPTEYDFTDLEIESSWKGFHLASLDLYIPNRFTSADRRSIGIHNLLIDPAITAEVLVQNILPFDEGNIKGWGISIDEFALTMVQNTVLSGRMEGDFGTPLFQRTADNGIDVEQFLGYEAVISREGEEDDDDRYYKFEARVQPQQDTTFKLPFAAATATICASSYLGVQIAPGEENTHMEVFLKGQMGIDLTEFIAEDAGELILPAAQYQVRYNTNQGFVMESDANANGNGTTIGLGLTPEDASCANFHEPDWDQVFTDLRNGVNNFGNGSERTTSDSEDLTAVETDNSTIDEDAFADENKMNGFPIRLGNFAMGLENGAPKLSFTVDLALASGSEGFAAGAGLTIYTATSENENNKLGFKLDRVQFDCARLVADLQMFTLIGALCYTNDGTNKGYAGRIIADINGQVTLDLSAGYYTYGSPEGGHAFGSAQYHDWWYADARIEMESGIPIGPISLQAFGGGIYWNTLPPDLPGHDDLRGLDDEENQIPGVNETIADLQSNYGIDIPASSAASLSSSPQRDYGMRAIKVNTGLSIIRPQLVCIDPSAFVTWEEGVGIQQISVGGYVYVLQDSYLGRGAPTQPAQNGGDGGSISFDISSAEGLGSRLWLSGFINLYFDYESSDKTLVAFESTGEVFLNMIPNILYGDMSGAQYKLIDQDILITHKDHYVVGQRGIDVAGIDGSTYWHAYFGNPYDEAVGPGAVAFDLMGAIGGEASESGSAGIRATAYFMMGNGIPSELPPIPEEIERIIARGSSAGDEDNEGTLTAGVDEGGSRNGSTTTGLVFGTGVQIGIGFEKIIYATLDVTIGGDILLADFSDFQCEANGRTYQPPGVSGFYGLGRVYAGLEGAVGIRGKIGPIKVDVKILELGAGIMLEMGGPNPFWLDGRAGIYYSVLGGTISGNAYVEVSAGDKCYPYNATPFSLEVIDRIYPDDSYSQSSPADPLAKPSVTFTVPVAMPSSPEDAALQIPTVTSNGATLVRTIAPVIESFDLSPTNNNPLSIDGSWELTPNGKKVKFSPRSALAGPDYDQDPKRWKLDLALRFKEKINGNWSYMDREYDQDTTVRFWTAPLGPYINNVSYTNPIKGQRYFMEHEWDNEGQMLIFNAKNGLIKFSNNVKDDRFYNEDPNTGSACEYHVVVRDAGTMEEVSRYQLQEDDIFNRKIVFQLPTLPRDDIYILQLVRKKEFSLADYTSGLISRSYTATLSNVTSLSSDLYNEYEIEYEAEEINPYEEVGANETLLHMFPFGTSDFETLRDKMQNADLTYVAKEDGCTNYTCPAYDKLNIAPDSEWFEDIEINGLTTELRDDAGYLIGSYYTPPRIRIRDPLQGELFDEIVPLMGDFFDEIIPELWYCPVYNLGGGCSSIYAQNPIELDLSTDASSLRSPLKFNTISLGLGLGDYVDVTQFVSISSVDFDAEGQIEINYDVRRDLMLDVEDAIELAEDHSDLFTETRWFFSIGGGSAGSTEVRSDLGHIYDDLVAWYDDHLPSLLMVSYNGWGSSASSMSSPYRYDPSEIQFLYNTSDVDGGSTTSSSGSSVKIETSN